MLTITFDDVCADPKVVEALRNMVSLPLLFPEQFEYGVLARQGLGGILLYGPPGTGKTTLCRALAYECGAQMLILKPSDIFNRWAGESEKLASAVFVNSFFSFHYRPCLTVDLQSLARKLSPCVIFIDEADTLFAERSDDSDWRDDIVRVNCFTTYLL
jgi:SpoVK/Ycf46/Vps4 family AAA+-type ATPase